ncbi:hypothetical protein GCM10012275_15230 [Longimycelium tulufanense]|uniref:DNA polymerase I n=1 Tax=Longimycelium tulufanense TaxID=907463 RepID=A0A8J3FTX3_9PSEU|nr:hypothetical protein GCM10012275_15230 [Longimycelium tulufanense]
MRQITYHVQGEPVVINQAERPDDLDEFRHFVRRNLRLLACDSETTGLDVYAHGFRVRLVQLGTPREAWVIPIELGETFTQDVRRTLMHVEKLVLHNGSYDLQVFDRCLGIKLEHLWPKVIDTKILAHLVDPRGRDEGGTGHSLEALTAHYLDERVAEHVKGLTTRLASRYKTTKQQIWSTVDLDDEEYNLYAGMHPILAARLLTTLQPLVPRSAHGLVPFEHRIAEICSYLERTGFLLDVPYTEGLSTQLREDEERYTEIARKHGCDNVNSTDQVADVLEHRKVQITGRTPTGRRQVNKALLDQLATNGDKFAIAVKEAKRARKWRTTWVDTFLKNRDEHDRCHASINALRARTARMSITGIPAQTLPAGDWLIRRCFVAEEGHRITSVDYQAQELRVLAALAGDTTMIRAFREGADLHLITARAAFGPHVTADSTERKHAKVVNFGRVYGGGAHTVAQQTGLNLETATRVVKAFDDRYPAVARLSRRLAREATHNGAITTPSGRVLPVDKGRRYAALNYYIQSASRDVTCRGLLRLHQAGYSPFVRLPIHDEVVVSLPAEHAHRAAQHIADLMRDQIGPVVIDTDAEVGQRSWGSLYGADY